MNLLRTLAGTAYGSDQDTLLRIHQAMILSVIEYGSVAYSSGNKTTLKQLNPIYNESMRTALGAFRSSALEYLENESGLEDLERRRDRRTMNLGATILAMANHPLQESMKERRETNDHHGFTQRARNLFDKYSIELQDLETINVTTHAPWNRKDINIDLTLSSIRIDKTQQCPCMPLNSTKSLGNMILT